LLLPEARFFGKDFLFTFIVEGTNVSSLVTSRIQQDNSYYESWCYFYLGLFAFENSARPKNIGQEYIEGHYFIWVKLMEWISGNDSKSSHKDSNEDRAIKHFIGSWESWKNRIGKDDATISDSEYWYKITHLERTSHMAITSIKHKNIEAAKWAIDALIYWEDEFIEIHKLANYYMWHSAIVTPDLMQDIPEGLKELIAEKNNFNEIEAATISLLNYWTDIRCLTAAYIISLTGYIDNHILKEFLSYITEAKRIKPSGHISNTTNSINNASELIGIYLRQNGSWNTQNDYKERLEKHIENVARIQEPAWVSGRVYSFDGNTRDQYLSVFFTTYGIGLSTREFSISRDWQSFLNSCSIVEKENLINSLSSLKSTTEEIEEKIIDLFDIDHEEMKSRKSNFEKSVDVLINDLKEDTTRSIIESDVDENILRSYSSYASENNFSKEKGPIPLSMFDKVFHTSASEVTLRTFKITNFNKSNVGRGLEVNRAINEKEWLNNVMRQRAQLDTFRKLIMGTNWTNHEVKSANEVIEHAVNEGRSIIKSGKTPILFIGPWSVFKKIDSSKWDYTPKSERLPYEIKIESGMPESYICHIDGIETYRLPFSRSPECFLTPKENMESLEIAEFDEGIYVNIAFEESEDDPLTGTLSLRYGIEPRIGIEKGHRYILSDAED
ncbi:hypothetical protein, partial [Chromohalobacter canadensis]|uniref:hypothetical protein n=1 Tax=Chromohalobacter canadensis TaxID=141389 RepID=UPI001FF3A86D